MFYLNRTTLGIIYICFCLLMSLFAFIAMGVDKRLAKLQRRRISEKTLFLLSGFFGGMGGTLGMFLFHHKTKHWYFRVFFPLFFVLQVLLGTLIFLL